MAARFDVVGLLAEAESAVENTQTYVGACRVLDYPHPDLTLYPAQIRDWFGTEDGLNLYALDADCSDFQLAVAAAEQSLNMQTEQSARLSSYWRGTGAEAAHTLLRGHCNAAASAVASARAAADALRVLRDKLWDLVYDKVSTLAAIDNRRQLERPEWLAAARAVIAGVGDSAGARELILHQVIPYVDSDIRADWLTAARAAIVSIEQAYDGATAAMAAQPPGHFELPDEIGASSGSGSVTYLQPQNTPSPHPAPSGFPPPPSAPAAATDNGLPPAIGQGHLPDADPANPDMSTPALPPSTAALPSAPASPFADVAGFGQRLGDAIARLLPSGAPSDLLGADWPDDGADSLAVDEVGTDAEAADEAVDANAADGIEQGASEVIERRELGAELGMDPAAQPGDALAAPQPSHEESPGDGEPAGAPGAVEATEASTPCQAAEDELPQVGR